MTNGNTQKTTIKTVNSTNNISRISMKREIIIIVIKIIFFLKKFILIFISFHYRNFDSNHQ